ncbi:BCCT family transporter [Bacillus massiliglaciei]|uniref:BCCT family transporter n=1 Tax=Bacillus massiliglaciei TaxID=1816693 RepID=UPI000AE0D681|nr:BCCT family transporter [Bacillus massiliglaciei]
MKKSVWKNPVFTISVIIISLLVLLGAAVPGKFQSAANYLFNLTTNNFGWFYLLAVFIIVVFLIGLAISGYGRIRLGGEDERPEFSFFTWIGMLFSAGFGAGLVFWGIAEPMSHFYSTPFAGVEGETREAARIAMGYSFFHWGVSQWSVFAIVGLIIGFLQFRKKKNALISTALEDVTGKKPAVKHTIDTLAVIATVLGIATSVGLGVLQMNGGLNAVFGIGNSVGIQMCIIAFMFIAYMISSTTGLQKGIKILSNLNLGLALAILVFVFIAGPTVFILDTFTLAIGDFFTHFIEYSLRMQPYQNGTWVRDWTIFYWAWAIAWSPFVGAFIARVSKGRTIREFIIGVMVIPPAIACIWIATFGGTGLWNDLNNGTGIAKAVHSDLTAALFQTFDYLPMSNVLSVLSIILIFTFIITSADSATYILASMTSNGSLNPPRMGKWIWGILMGAISAVLLYAGGLEALQTASLIAALPFTVLLLILVVSAIKYLKKEPLPIRKADVKRFRKLEMEAKKDTHKKKNA